MLTQEMVELSRRDSSPFSQVELLAWLFDPALPIRALYRECQRDLALHNLRPPGQTSRIGGELRRDVHNQTDSNRIRNYGAFHDRGTRRSCYRRVTFRQR